MTTESLQLRKSWGTCQFQCVVQGRDGTFTSRPQNAFAHNALSDDLIFSEGEMMALSLLPSSFAPPLAAARPTIPGARSAPVMLDSAKIFRPAQFWESETASMLDL